MASFKSVLYKRDSIVASVIFFPFFATSFFRLDPDFGWHLKAGEYIRNHGIPRYDIFTYTAPDFHWINHEWLTDVIIYFLFELHGYFLVAVFFAMLWTFAFFLAFRKKSLFVSLLATLAILPYAGIRPIVWSLIFFALLERIAESKLKHKEIIIPALFFIWANLHGGFFLGLVVLALLILQKKHSISFLVLPISFLATLINPYGIDLYTEITRTLFDASLRFSIFEWQPFIVPAFSMFYISLLCALFLFIYKKKIKKIPLLPLFLLFNSAASTRHTPFFIISSIRYLEKYLKRFKTFIPYNLSGTRLMSLRFLKLLAFILVLYGFVMALLPKDREASYPKKAISYLMANPCPGNLFNIYGHGGYLIWKLPGKKVYIDGRMPSWESSEGKYLNTYGQIFTKEGMWEKEFKKHEVRCALLDRETDKTYKVRDKILSERLKEKGWVKVVEDDKILLLIQK